MRILFISSTYPTPVRPRQGAFNRVLVSGLREGHDVRVIAPVPWTQLLAWSPLKALLQGDGHSRRQAQAVELYPPFFYMPRLARQLAGRWLWHSVRGPLQRMLREWQPDVVCGYWLYPDGHAAAEAASLANAPLVLMSGGSDLRLLPKTSRRRRQIEQVLGQCARLLVVSHELRQHAVALQVPPAKIDVIYRGVERSTFYPQERAPCRAALDMSPDTIVLLWVGRLEPVKNPLLFLEAVEHWRRQWGTAFQAVMIGDGSLRTPVAQHIAQRGLSECVSLLPAMSQQGLAKYYCAANLTVLTSHSEGIPNVLLESLACETPFLATNVGGVAEIATAGRDRLVPSGELQPLVSAGIELISQTALPPATFVPQDSHHMARQVEHSLSQVLRRGHSHRRASSAGEAA